MEDKTIPVTTTKINWPKVIVFSFIEIILFGLAFITGLTIGKNQNIKTTQPSQNSVETQTLVVATPTIDSIADWKTYTNNKYGYSLKYPNDEKVFILNSCANTQGKTGDEYLEGIFNNKFDPKILSVCNIVSINPAFYAYIQKGTYSNPLGEDYQVLSDQTKTVGNNKFRVITYHLDKNTDGFDERWNNVTHYVITNTIKNFSVVFELNNLEEPETSVATQILSTFKFTDSTAQSTTISKEEALKIKNDVIKAITNKDINFFLNYLDHKTESCSGWENTPFSANFERICGQEKTVIVYYQSIWGSEGSALSENEMKTLLTKSFNKGMRYEHLYITGEDNKYALTFINGFGSLIISKNRANTIVGYDPINAPEINFTQID